MSGKEKEHWWSLGRRLRAEYGDRQRALPVLGALWSLSIGLVSLLRPPQSEGVNAGPSISFVFAQCTNSFQECRYLIIWCCQMSIVNLLAVYKSDSLSRKVRGLWQQDVFKHVCACACVHTHIPMPTCSLAPCPVHSETLASRSTWDSAASWSWQKCCDPLVKYSNYY